MSQQLFSASHAGGALLIALLVLGCEDSTSSSTPEPDVTVDAQVADMNLDAEGAEPDGEPLPPDGPAPDAAPDAGPDAQPDAPPRPPRETRVEVDLEPYLGGGGEGAVRVFVSESADDLIGGEASTAQVGDYVLENERVRFVVEQAVRVIGPCPWGGNVIDADIRREGPGQDVVGELCPFINAGMTIAPDAFEILQDGSDGVGVLAVTGHLELLDFINLVGIAAGFLNGIDLRLPFDPDEDLPLSLTIYYIIRAGDPGLRVVTAFRNEGGEALHFPISHLIDSGGDVRFFSPTNSLGGFGYTGLNADQLAGEPLPFLAFRGAQSSHTYVPKPVEGLGEGFPSAGRYFAVAGVAVSLLGAADLIRTLLVPPSALPDSPGVMHIDAGAIQTMEYWHLAGDGSLASTVDFALNAIGLELGSITGTVRDAEGAPIPRARVSAVEALEEGERTLNQAMSDAEGNFSMRVPAGTYELRAELTGRLAEERPSLAVTPDAPARADLVLRERGALRVRITKPGGEATPAKVTVLCVGGCPQRHTSRERDVTFDGPVSNSAATAYVGVEGEVEIPLAPGDYKVVVSRGMEWSVWPRDLQAGGEPVEVVAGEVAELEAEIAHVVDTSGAMTGDFHVHGIYSPDSPVPQEERVRIFMAEGVDVLVSTDHDFITDYAPHIEALGGTAELTSIVGEELTTFDYGHYNGFPLPRDPSKRNGGAWDWAGAEGPGKTPGQIFEWFHSNPGTQVVQVNHPNGGYWRAVAADVLRGITTADASRFRLDVPEPDPETGDTHLWDEGFTAFELSNGHSRGRFWSIARWWLTMVGRGFTPTGTAVSDTHKAIRSLGGSPRTIVFVDRDKDTPQTFDQEHFATNVNAGKAIGTSGPFFRVVATNGGGDMAGLGDTLDASGPVTISVTVDVPEWMHVDTLSVYANPEDALVTEIGEPANDPLTPTQVHPIEFAPEDTLEVAPGHAHKVKVVSFELDVEADTFVIFIVSGDEGPSMFPVVHSGGTRPFAWSNPMYLDADGGGYDNPPFAEAAASPAVPRPAPDARMATPADLRQLLRETAHDH